MPNEIEYYPNFNCLVDPSKRRFEMFSEPEGRGRVTLMLNEYLKKELKSPDYEGKYPEEEKMLKDVEHYAFDHFRCVLKLPLLDDGVHFYRVNLFEAAKKPKIMLENLVSDVIFRIFFRKCLKVFERIKISDEMLLKSLLIDRTMFDHYIADSPEKGIDREEHMKEFLAKNQVFLELFEERFDAARKLTFDEETAPTKILKRLNLSSISIENLMIFKVEFAQILKRFNNHPSDPECLLCQEVDVMEFLMDLDNFSRFAEGVKSVFVPRYLLFAMVISKAFKAHLLPYGHYGNLFGFENSSNEIEELFNKRARIEFSPGSKRSSNMQAYDCNLLKVDIYEMMMCLQFTTLFREDVGGWGDNHDFTEFLFYNFMNGESYSLSKRMHSWCDGSDHSIEDPDLTRKALNYIIMLAIIGTGVLRAHLAVHSLD